jgi:hypothetical protein
MSRWRRKYEAGREERGSFLKRRTKQLFLIWSVSVAITVPHLPRWIHKSFLLLFFKKEALPCLAEMPA